MGWLDWLFGRKYDKSSALIYVKSNPKYLKNIHIEKRKEFQDLFTKLIDAEISNLGRGLNEKEINTIVNIIRLKLSRVKGTKDNIQAGQFLISLNSINTTLIRTLEETEAFISSSDDSKNISASIGTLLKDLIKARIELKSLSIPNSKIYSEAINLEITLISELLNNIYPKKNISIPRNQILKMLSISKKTLNELNNSMIARLADLQEAA